MPSRRILAALSLLLAAAACSSSSSGPREPRYTIVKPEDQTASRGGVPPDKENEIRLLMQQREPSARKCYQDVLNEKHDRAFQGTVQLLVTIQPSGQASAVKVVGGTLTDKEVQDCLVQTVQQFEFPSLDATGDVQYTYQFRPAY